MSVTHSGLGDLVSAVVPTKSSLKDALKLGAGAAAAVTLSDLAQNKLLVSNGRPLVPMAWAPVFTAAFGIVAGGIVAKKWSGELGKGMVAGGVGVGMAALIAKYTSPMTAATVAAGSTAENAGAPPQAVSGFGFGRAYASGARGLSGLAGIAGGSGLGRLPQNPAMLFGVGTPDMRAARAFNGATVAIEQPGLSGATVAIQQPSMFAGALT
jgi:hypothetical protein